MHAIATTRKRRTPVVTLFLSRRFRLRSARIALSPCKPTYDFKNNCPTNIPTPFVNFLKALYCLSIAPSIVRFHKDQGSQKTVRDNGETKSWRGSFCVRSRTQELRLSALLHPEETKAWSEKKRCEHPHMAHDFLVNCGAFVVSVDVLDTYGGGRHAPLPTAGCFCVPPASQSLRRVQYASP